MADPGAAPAGDEDRGTGLLAHVASLLELLATIEKRRGDDPTDVSADFVKQTAKFKEQLTSFMQAVDTSPGVHASREAHMRALEEAEAEIKLHDRLIAKYAAMLAAEPSSQGDPDDASMA